MTPADLLTWVRRRLVKKFRQAESAYIHQFLLKQTHNCKHSGRKLSDKNYHCKINALGTDEVGATQCWDEKAGLCPLFVLKRSPDELRAVFRRMDTEELSLRWPALGELIRVEALVRQLDGLNTREEDSEISESPVQHSQSGLSSTPSTGVDSGGAGFCRDSGIRRTGDAPACITAVG